MSSLKTFYGYPLPRGMMKRAACHQPTLTVDVNQLKIAGWSTSTVEKCSLHFSTWQTSTILHLSTVDVVLSCAIPSPLPIRQHHQCLLSSQQLAYTQEHRQGNIWPTSHRRQQNRKNKNLNLKIKIIIFLVFLNCEFLRYFWHQRMFRVYILF